MDTNSMMDESPYRALVDEVFRALDAGFEHVDPDLAESAYSSGTLVITMLEKHKLILSPQSPVRQIWIAFRDRAWHLSLDQASGKWLDDRGEGKELFSLVASLVADTAKVTVSFAPKA
jgi:CyaY protein